MLSSAPEPSAKPPPAQQAWNGLVRLRELATERGWTLSDGQTRDMLQLGLAWDDKRDASVASDKETRRLEHLRQLWEVVIDLPKATGEDLERDGAMLERYRLARVRRDDELVEDDELRDRASRVVELAFADTGGTTSLSPDSRILTSLFATDRPAALAHLHAMLDADRVPSAAFMMRAALGDEAKAEDAMYARARRRLDAACRGGPTAAANSELEALLAERLERIDHLARIKQFPAREFLRVLADGPPQTHAGEPSHEDYLFAALRLWEALAPQSYSPATYDVLEYLIRALLDRPPRKQASPTPSPALVKAVELASTHLPTPRLVFMSNRVLTALTATYPSLRLSRAFYSTLRTRAPFDAPTPFIWSVGLRAAWTYLVRTSMLSAQPDPALGLRLYLDWTASGLLPPQYSWELMWRTLGAVASVEDTTRMVQDFERAGKIVPARVATTVLRWAVSADRLVSVLRLLDFFREQFPGARVWPIREPVPLEAFNLVLQYLAESRHDRRRDSITVFRHLVHDGLTPDVRTWNALLASHVFRQLPIIRADLTAATKVYEHILQQPSLEPDATTYSLLMHAGLRLANEDSQSNTGLETAVEALAQAQKREVLVRGQQLATLMHALARQRRWEDAKAAGEAWWALSLKQDATRAGTEAERRDEDDLVRQAGSVVVRSETADARRAWSTRAPAMGSEQVLDQQAAELRSFRLDPGQLEDDAGIHFPASPSAREVFRQQQSKST